MMWTAKSLVSIIQPCNTSSHPPPLSTSTRQSPPTSVSWRRRNLLSSTSSSSVPYKRGFGIKIDHAAPIQSSRSPQSSGDELKTQDTHNRIQKKQPPPPQKLKQEGGGSELSGSVVLMALQKAQAQKKRKMEKKKTEARNKKEDRASSDQANDKDAIARPLNVKSDWGPRIEELEKRLWSEFMDI